MTAPKTLTMIACITTVAFAAEPSQLEPWEVVRGEMTRSLTEAEEVVVVCTYDVTVEADPTPGVFTLVHHATVTRSFKGSLMVGDRVLIGIPTDSLPANGSGQKKALDAIAADARGSLKFAFLSGGKSTRFDTNFRHFWNYRAEYAALLDELAAQDGAAQPTSKALPEGAGADAPDADRQGGVPVSPEELAATEMIPIANGLERYRAMCGFYPTTEQGLTALVARPQIAPAPRRWMQLFSKLPLDPWNRHYQYRRDDKVFRLWSMGARMDDPEDDVYFTDGPISDSL